MIFTYASRRSRKKKLESIKKARMVKPHYRKLPNGSIIYIDQHWDKRDAAKREPEKWSGKVVHVDEKSTTINKKNNKVKSRFEHVKHDHDKKVHELSKEQIHAHLNQNVDTYEMARKMAMKHFGIKKHDEEFRKKHIKPLAKHLEKTYGKSSSLAAMSGHRQVNDYLHHVVDTHDPKSEDADHHDHAMAKMAIEHSDDALDSLAQEREEVHVAKAKGPKDCPVINAISNDISFFGHQAEVLAKLDVLSKAVIDVDMGGGKGLLLPADALNLMQKGSVKKPLIVVPAATLDQNASKVINEYTDAKVNVFKITNQTLKDHYNGDAQKMVEDIHKAPENTIFMASYDVFSYQSKDPTTKKAYEDEEKRFERGRTLSSAGFDYCALDEAHNIKNTKTNRFKAMKYLTTAKYRRVASGTFLSNNPMDVLGQMKWLHPSWDMTEDQFKKEYGHTETKGGVHWDEQGLKNLRDDLDDMGMISLRRSAWLHNLPKRDERLSFVEMDKELKSVNELAITNFVEQLREEAEKNPKLKKALAEDDADELLQGNPKIVGGLDTLGGITDYPDMMADLVEESFKTLRQGKKAGGSIETDDDMAQAKQYLDRFKPHVRKAIRALKGVVSPKAKDVYKKLDEHFADKKNGKYIVFCQRRMSAAHIMKHMPEEHKKNAMYFDASQMGKLDSFAKDPDGPKIIVAVDASIKEGMNLQIANGMYRYDHHFSPGNQEQSYARIWRFGQDKPAKIHLGIVDQGVDVTKYCRMMSKYHQNMHVISDFPEDPTLVAFKLSLSNIESNRGSDIVPKYHQKGLDILNFQAEENRELRKHYGDKPFKRSGGKGFGKGAEMKHGIGPYHTEFTGKEEKGKLTDDEKNSLAGHMRDALRKHFGDEMTYDDDHWDAYLPEAVELAGRHKLKGHMGKNVHKDTWESYHNEYQHEAEEKHDDDEKKFLHDVVNRWSSGKKHTPHSKLDHHDALMSSWDEVGVPYKEQAMPILQGDTEELLSLLKKKKTRFERDHNNRPLTHPVVEAFWKKWAEEDGGAPSRNYKNMVNHAVSKMMEHEGGWETMKNRHQHKLKEK